MLKLIVMKNYKKYKALYSMAYIVFFSYLLILSLGNFDFGKYEVYMPYFIVIPFLIYCFIVIFSKIMMNKTFEKRIKDDNERKLTLDLNATK